jgi:hypothetical protein
MPSEVAFCLTAPGVRFIALEISSRGVLAFECRFSSLTSSVVHSLRAGGFAFFAIDVILLGYALGIPSLMRSATVEVFEATSKRRTRVDNFSHDAYVACDPLVE